MTDTKRRPDETETQYIWRICSAKDNGTLDITWEGVAEILNKELRDNEDEYYGSSAYRKKYQQAKLFRDEVFSKETDEESEKKYLEQKRELERLKVAYRDQRNSWAKQNYVASRVDQNLEYLSEQLQQIGKREFVATAPATKGGNQSLIVCLSDLHEGQTFDSAFGKYDSQISKERMDRYLSKVIEIGERFDIDDCYTVLLGDMISGNNHLSIQVSNRENLIDQIKLAVDYITNFITELSKHFKTVTVAGIAGNHSRTIADITKDIKDERLDTLITWCIARFTEHIPNVTVITDNLDSTVTAIKVRNQEYVLTHGDMSGTSDSEISKLVLALGSFPYAILCGHKHSPMYKEFNGIKVIQSGSLASAGDDYCITKRLTGKANQTCIVTDADGKIESIYNVELS